MTQIDDATRVRHILDAANRARNLLEGHSRQDLDSDDVLGLALVRLLEILGEAARGVSPELRTRYPAIPWHQLVSTRNRMIHAYFSVDMDIVWSIIEGDLPSLIHQLEHVVASEGWV
jgi:uncharacterized protein with HEPN domain